MNNKHYLEKAKKKRSTTSFVCSTHICHCETGNNTVKDGVTAAVHKGLIYSTYLAMNHVECLVLDSVHSAHGATPARRAAATGTVAVRRHLNSAAPRSTRANKLQLQCLSELI